MAASLPLVSPGTLLGPEPPAAAAAPPPAVQFVSTAATLRRQSSASAQDDPRWQRGGQERASTVVITSPRFAAAAAPPPAPAAPPVVAPPAPAAPPVLDDPRPMRYVAVPLGDEVPAKVRRYEALIQRYAEQYDVDPRFVAAVMMTESGGNPSAVSHANAVGLMQILNGPLDPARNIATGAEMLGAYLTRYGSTELTLAAYNAGPGNVARYRGVPPFEETHQHIARTLSSYAAFSLSPATAA